MLNATVIGKHFNVSSQKINLILSELGFIENDIAGWRITKLGRNLGGKQSEFTSNGNLYVVWPDSILQNKSLKQFFEDNETNSNGRYEDPFFKEVAEFFDGPQKRTKPVVPSSANQVDTENIRNKYPKKYRTRDGHWVRSKAEVIIDDWLYTYGLVHAYERKLPVGENVISDFYIPAANGRPQGVFIEFWGLENDKEYVERMRWKIEVYRKNELPLIELFESDIQNIDDVLPRKLLQYKIKVG